MAKDARARSFEKAMLDALDAGTASEYDQKLAAAELRRLIRQRAVIEDLKIGYLVAAELTRVKKGTPSRQVVKGKRRRPKHGAYQTFRAVLSDRSVWYGGTYERDREGRPSVEAARVSIQSMVDNIYTAALVRFTRPGSGRFHYHRVPRTEIPTVVEIAEAGTPPTEKG